MSEAEPARGAGHQVLSGALTSGVLQIVSALFFLALTPAILVHLGIAAYGFWSLMMTIVRFTLFADFGIGPSVTKHVAESWANKDRHGVRSAATIGMLYYFCLSVVVLGVAALAGPALLSHLKMPAELHRIAPAMLLGFTLYFACSLTFWGSFSATLNGLGLLRLTAFANAVGSITSTATIGFSLAMGFGLKGMLVGSFVQVAVAALIGQVAIYRTCGGSLVAPWTLSKSLVRRMLSFGGWVQISTIANLVNCETPMLILGYFAGVESVAVFDIGSRLARCVKALAFHFNSALLPAVTAIEYRHGSVRSRATIATAHRFLSVTSFAVMGLLVATAPVVLNLWLGNRSVNGPTLYAVVIAMAGVYLVENFVTVAITGLRGLGRPQFEASYALVYAGVDLGISVLLTPHFGLAGVLAGLGCGVLAGAFSFGYTVVRSGAGSGGILMGFWIARLSAATAIAVAVTASLYAVVPLHAAHRMLSLAALASLGIAYAVTFVAALGAVRFLTETDLTLVRRILPRRFDPVLAAPLTRKLFGAA